MADGRKWGDDFANWFVALAYGKKFVASLLLASIAILGPTLTATALIPPPEKTVEITCGDRKVIISQDDPIFDENDIEASAVRMCALPY